MKAAIVSIGDELVLGQTVDSNAAWLSARLAPLGVNVSEHVTVSDNMDMIVDAFKRLAASNQIVIVTGGLGPTDDDLTRHAMAAVLGTHVELHEPSLDRIERFFYKIQRPMSSKNKIQAMIPVGAEVIDNSMGTAPGIKAKVDQTSFYLMPGVPAEMKAMFEETIQPELMEETSNSLVQEVILTRTLHTIGAGESNVAEILGDMMQRNRNPLVNSTVSHGVVSIRIVARAENTDAAEAMIQPIEAELRNRLGSFVFGVDNDTLPSVVGELLRDNNAMLAVAESCTGGLLAKLLTDVSGSSDYFKIGWITYSNSAKAKFLNVNPDLIERFGAVSEQVARDMAKQALDISKADYALAITGIAGPTGATEDKPVGLVYIALAAKTGVSVFHRVFTGGRERIRLLSANTALDMLRQIITPGLSDVEEVTG